MTITNAIVRSLGPITINSTTLPTLGTRFVPGALSEAFGHSGNEFDTVNRAPGAEVKAMATIPFWDAYNLIGWKSLKCTTLDIYEAKYVDAARSASSVHRKYALTASAVAHATIRSVTVAGPRALALAEVELTYLASGPVTHPITVTDNNALPALSSAPTLHTGGMIGIAGTTYGAINSMTLETGNRLESYTHAGAAYPTVSQYLEGKPTVRGSFADPVALFDEIGLEGQALTGTGNDILWFRSYDGTTGELLTTGAKIVLTYGRILPDGELAMALRVTDSMTFRIDSLASPSTPSTHPWVTSNAQALPT